MVDQPWQTLISGFEGYEIRSPAEPAVVHGAMAALGATASPELQELYQTTDGVFDSAGQWFVVWPIATLVSRTLEDWERFAHPTLVAFGDDGTGDAFCVPRDGSEGVYHWSETDAEATWLDKSMKRFWLTLAAGELRL